MTDSVNGRMRDWAIAICLAVVLTCGVTTAKANGSDMQGSNGLDVALVQQESGLNVTLEQKMRDEDNAELVNYHQVDEHGNDIQHPIAPIAESDLQSRDASFNMPLAGGFADMIVTARNDLASSEACVRVVVAVPSAFDGHLHWEEGDLLWMGDASVDNWILSSKVEGVSVNGGTYDLVSYDYRHVLTPGSETVTPAITGFYLDERIDIEDGAFIYVGADGSVSNLGVTEAHVMVDVQACSPLATDTPAEDGLTPAERSLAAAFGELSATNHPWAQRFLFDGLSTARLN